MLLTKYDEEVFAMIVEITCQSAEVAAVRRDLRRGGGKEYDDDKLTAICAG